MSIYPLQITRNNEQKAPVFTLYRSITHPSLGLGGLPVASRTIPQMLDLRSKMPPVYEQGDLDSCTANAICTVLQYNDSTLQGSRMFLYYNERVVEGGAKEIMGTAIEDGIASMTSFGVCAEADWPYDTSLFAIQPPNECYAEAKEHMGHRVYSLPKSVMEMKRTLVAGFPIIVGIKVYESFESRGVSHSGIVPMPGPAEPCLGGHTVVCVGYNDITSRWILRNSWGSRWGDKGYFYVPYRYLLDPNFSSELWVIGV